MRTITDTAELIQLGNTSAYTIVGAGGNLDEWIAGYNDLLNDAGIFKKGQELDWFSWKGELMNEAFGLSGDVSYQDDLTFLAFAINGETMDIGKLALFKIRNNDRWLDDIVQNNARHMSGE